MTGRTLLHYRLMLLSLAIALAASRAAAGQGGTTLRGTITDSSGAVIPGVVVTLVNVATAHHEQ